MQWTEVIENPILKDLPFKVELNKWGQILMSPISNNHGRWTFKVGKILGQQKGSGEVITSKKLKAWDEFFELLDDIDVPEDFLLERDNDVLQVRDLFR